MIDFKEKFVIIRAEENGEHLRRLIYTEYKEKQKDILTLSIPLKWFEEGNINSNTGYKKKKNKIQLYDIELNKLYNLFGRINNDMIIIKIDEKYTAITSKWPKELPKNLPFKVKVISKHNLGEPSMWRVARFVIDEKTNKLYFLKLMPMEDKRERERAGTTKSTLADKMDRVYKELNNSKKCKSKYILSSKIGECGNWLWALIETATKGSVKKYKSLVVDNIIPDYIALYIFKQILLGVKVIHAKNIYHNFLNLEKILFDDNYNVKISDFGSSIDSKNMTEYERNVYFSKLLPSFLNYKSKMTFPPEWKKKVVYNEKTDVWSLGILLRDMVTNGHTHISPNIESFLKNLLNPNPNKRQTVSQLLNHKLIRSIDLSNENKLNSVTREIKFALFTDYFLKLYKDTFHFKKDVSDKYKKLYINKNLLSFTRTFSYDIYTGWDSVLKKIWYHDQATITNKKWKNTINITEFESNDYFEININDLKSNRLPVKYHGYISSSKWNKFKQHFNKTLKGSNKHFNNQEFKPFEYTDLEVDEKTYESLYSKPLISNGVKVEVKGNKQVLSMIVKISSKQGNCLDAEGRTLPDNRSINTDSVYIPIQLCESDIISALMASCWSEYIICKKKFSESFCYITIRKSFVKPSLNQGVGGWHVDGAWGKQTYRHPDVGCGQKLYNGTFTDRNYLIQSSPEIRTPVAVIALDLSEIIKKAFEKYKKGQIIIPPQPFISKELILHKYLTRNRQEAPWQPPSISDILDQAVSQAPPSSIKRLPANKLNFFTAYTIHKVPINNSGKTINRSTIRIAFSSDYFDKACGPTISPVLGIPGKLIFFPYPEPYKLNDRGKKSTRLIKNKLYDKVRRRVVSKVRKLTTKFIKRNHANKKRKRTKRKYKRKMRTTRKSFLKRKKTKKI